MRSIYIYIYDISSLRVNVLTVLRSGSLNLLEPAGPVQACDGIALPLPLPLQREKKNAVKFKFHNYNKLLILLLKM